MTNELKQDGEAAKGGADPSMEDILASIRRIIAEEGEGRGEAGAEAAPAGILDLTEMVAEDGSVVSLPPHPLDAAEAAEPAAPAPAPVQAPVQAQPPVQPVPPVQPDPAPLDNFVEAVAPPIPPTRMAVQEDSPMSSVPPTREPLVSTPAANVARNAFAQLAEASRPASASHEAAGGGRTVEQLAEDLMRPMLKAWLDANLPAIVERAVAEELARITGRNAS